MKTSEKGYALIKEFESLELHAYPDPVSKGPPITIGWGSTTDESGAPIHLGDVWTAQRADARLAQFVGGLERALNAAIAKAGCVTLQSQYDAMICFAYNIKGGVERLLGSSIWKAHVRGDRVAAANSFGLWNKGVNGSGKMVPIAGLTRRRAAEAALYLADVPEAAEAHETTTSAEATSQSVGSRKTVIGTAAIAVTGAGQQLVQNLPQITAAHAQIAGVGGFSIVVKILGGLMVLAALFVLFEQYWKRRKGEA